MTDRPADGDAQPVAAAREGRSGPLTRTIRSGLDRLRAFDRRRPLVWDAAVTAFWTVAAVLDYTSGGWRTVAPMDIRMPGLDGIEASRHIIRSGSRTRVLIVTTFDLDAYAYDGLRAGASGFLVKDAQPEELLSGLRAVAAGDAVVAPP